jgi:uncharacterized membrane protein
MFKLSFIVLPLFLHPKHPVFLTVFEFPFIGNSFVEVDLNAFSVLAALAYLTTVYLFIKIVDDSFIFLAFLGVFPEVDAGVISLYCRRLDSDVELLE